MQFSALRRTVTELYYKGVMLSSFWQVVSAPTHPHGGPPGLGKKELKLPPGQTLEKLHKRHGLTDDEFTAMKRNVIRIKEAVYELRRHEKVRPLFSHFAEQKVSGLCWDFLLRFWSIHISALKVECGNAYLEIGRRRNKTTVNTTAMIRTSDFV